MDDRRLHGWKGIGAHLGVSVRTAERWHDQWGLPVHRATLRERSNVWAVTAELDAWLQSREGMAARGDGRRPSCQRGHRARTEGDGGALGRSLWA